MYTPRIVAVEPDVGHPASLLEEPARDLRREPAPPLTTGRRREAVRARRSARTAAGRGRDGSGAWWKKSAAPWSMGWSRPCHQSRFAFRAVRSGFVTSASSQTSPGRQLRLDRGLRGRVEGERAREEVDAEVEPGRAEQQVLDLRSGPGVAERRVERDERQAPGRGSRSARASSPATTSATSAFSALSRPAELEHVQPVVVGLDERRERAALAQRRHVARRLYRGAASREPILGP